MNLPPISYSENYYFLGNAHNNNIVMEFPSIHYCENVGFISYTNFHLITLWKTVVFHGFEVCAMSALTVEAVCFKWVMECIGQRCNMLIQEGCKGQSNQNFTPVPTTLKMEKECFSEMLVSPRSTSQCENTRQL